MQNAVFLAKENVDPHEAGVELKGERALNFASVTLGVPGQVTS